MGNAGKQTMTREVPSHLFCGILLFRLNINKKEEETLFKNMSQLWNSPRWAASLVHDTVGLVFVNI